VAGTAVGEQVPDDHKDGPDDGDEGLELAAALDDPPLPLAECGEPACVLCASASRRFGGAFKILAGKPRGGWVPQAAGLMSGASRVNYRNPTP
jgi:hypothetical protein